MTIYDLKNAFQNLLRPIVRLLFRIGITANAVTVFALILSMVTGLFLTIYDGYWWILPIVLFVRMALNAIDGMLAKEHNMKTPLGAFLNELSDVFSDAFLYMPFAWVAGFEPMKVAVIVMLSIITEMTGVIGVQVGASRRYDGPCGKSDRAFIFGLMAVLLMLDLPMKKYWLYFEWTLMALLLLTVANRVRSALKELS